MIPRILSTGWGAYSTSLTPAPSPPVTRSAPSGFSITLGYGTLTYTPATGLYSTDFDITTKRPTIINTFYVDPAGNDGSAGVSLGTAVATLGQAITLANTGAAAAKILCTSGLYNGVGANAVIPTQNLIIECTDGGQATFVRGIVYTSGPTLNSGSGYYYVYTTGTPYIVYDTTHLDANGDAIILTPVVDAATTVTTVNSYYLDTGAKRVYFRTFDSRNPSGDSGIKTTRTGDNFVMHSTAPKDLYMSKVDMWGGDRPMKMTATGAVTPTFAFNNCSFGYAGNDNAISWNCDGEVFGKNSKFIYDKKDGFNITRSGTQTPEFFLDTCRGSWNGWDGDGTNNGITGHLVTKGVILNCTADNNEDRCFHNVGTGLYWYLGCTGGPSKSSGDESSANFAMGATGGGDSVTAWLDGCTSAAASDYDLEAYGGCTIKTGNMSVGGFTNVTTGTITTYTP